MFHLRESGFKSSFPNFFNNLKLRRFWYQPRNGKAKTWRRTRPRSQLRRPLGETEAASDGADGWAQLLLRLTLKALLQSLAPLCQAVRLVTGLPFFLPEMEKREEAETRQRRPLSNSRDKCAAWSSRLLLPPSRVRLGPLIRFDLSRRFGAFGPLRGRTPNYLMTKLSGEHLTGRGFPTARPTNRCSARLRCVVSALRNFAVWLRRLALKRNTTLSGDHQCPSNAHLATRAEGGDGGGQTARQTETPPDWT